MGVTDEDINWAKSEIERLCSLYPPGALLTRDQGRADLIDGLEFLRLKAGTQSEFYRRALDASKRMHASVACKMVESALDGWIRFEGLGLVSLPVEAQQRQAAATDLMEQVDRLLQDRRSYRQHQ